MYKKKTGLLYPAFSQQNRQGHYSIDLRCKHFQYHNSLARVGCFDSTKFKPSCAKAKLASVLTTEKMTSPSKHASLAQKSYCILHLGLFRISFSNKMPFFRSHFHKQFEKFIWLEICWDKSAAWRVFLKLVHKESDTAVHGNQSAVQLSFDNKPSFTLMQFVTWFDSSKSMSSRTLFSAIEPFKSSLKKGSCPTFLSFHCCLH